MKYLNKLFFFDPVKKPVKRELYTTTDAIDFMTWFKHDIDSGTSLHMAVNGGKITHMVDGLPEIINKHIFGDLFFKATAFHVVEGGDTKKFTVWINPDNIETIYQNMPDSTLFIFRSGAMLPIVNKVPDILQALYSHVKEYKERKKQKYDKSKKQA